MEVLYYVKNYMVSAIKRNTNKELTMTSDSVNVHYSTEFDGHQIKQKECTGSNKTIIQKIIFPYLHKAPPFTCVIANICINNYLEKKKNDTIKK